MKLDNDTWVLVADGAKALTLVNEGDADIINLRRVSVKEEHHARTAEMGTDRPGRVHQSGANGTMRSAGEQTDWHAQAERDFVRGIADDIDEAMRAGRFRKLVIVAAPRALADLRNSLGADARAATVAELAKDLTSHPIPDIEKILTDWDPR